LVCLGGGGDPLDREKQVDEYELRRVLHGMLEGFDIRPPFDAAVLCERLAWARGREIRLIARDLPSPAVFGCLVPMLTKDLIIYPEQAAQPHRQHIIFHEVVHLIRRHVSTGGAGELLMCGQLPDGCAGAEHRQTLYDHWKEWEAEAGATMLTEWSKKRSRLILTRNHLSRPGNFHLR